MGHGVKCPLHGAVQPAKAMTAAPTLGKWSLKWRGLGRASPSVFLFRFFCCCWWWCFGFFLIQKYEVLSVASAWSLSKPSFLGIYHFYSGNDCCCFNPASCPSQPPWFFRLCCSPTHCLLFIPFRQTAVQLALAKKNQARQDWARLLTCHKKGGEEEMWPQPSLILETAHSCPALCPGPATGSSCAGATGSAEGLALMEEGRAWKSPAQKQTHYFVSTWETQAMWFCFFFLFLLYFLFRAEETLQIQVKKTQTFAFLSFSHICHDLDIPAVLK